MSDPDVIRAELGSPDAILVQTTSGSLVVIADPAVPDDQVAAIASASAVIPSQRPTAGRPG